MDTIKKLFGANPQRDQLPKFEGDDVYPAALLDDTKAFRDMILLWTFCFNDVLDPEKLHLSLGRLLEIGDWRKLGGRQRINDKNKLELHVPKAFTSERPAVRYSHEAIDMDTDDHPVAKNYPKATEGPSLHPGGKEFRQFAVTPDDPVNGSDLFMDDKPQMSLRIVSFKDSTIVSMVWPHSLMDMGGLQALLQNWSLVLAGRESEVLPLLGARRDITCAAAESPNSPDMIQELGPDEELQIAPRRVSGFKLFLFGIHFLWDIFWQGTSRTRTIFMPKKVIDGLRRQALEEVAGTTSGGDDEKPFVTEGDVIAAWAARMVAISDSRQAPVSIINAVNLRYRMKALMQTTGVYAQNLTTTLFTFLSPAMARGPLGPIALANRKHLLEQTTEPQLRALLRTLISESHEGGGPVLFGSSNMTLVIVSNWTKTELTQAADFSPAVIRQGEATETRRNKLGEMTQVHNSAAKDSIMSKNVMLVKGKDHEGNYWLEGSFVPKTWLKVEEEMAKLNADF